MELEIECERLTLKLAGDLTIQTKEGTVTKFSEINRRTGEKAYLGDSHGALIQDFYGSLRTGELFAIDWSSGRIALQMVQGIYLSAKQHRDVVWDELSDTK